MDIQFTKPISTKLENQTIESSCANFHVIDFVLFRSADVPTRKRYVKLVEEVKDNGGAFKIFSSLHISGERKLREERSYVRDW